MDTEIRVSTESWFWRRKFSWRSCQDSNLGPFDHESDALTTELTTWPYCHAAVSLLSTTWPYCHVAVSLMSTTWPYCDTAVSLLSTTWPYCDAAVSLLSTTWPYCHAAVSLLSATWPYCHATVSLLSVSLLPVTWPCWQFATIQGVMPLSTGGPSHPAPAGLAVCHHSGVGTRPCYRPRAGVRPWPHHLLLPSDLCRAGGHPCVRTSEDPAALQAPEPCCELVCDSFCCELICDSFCCELICDSFCCELICVPFCWVDLFHFAVS